MDIDDVYVRTGEFGRFQKQAFAACCLYCMFGGTQMVQNIFAGSIPTHMACVDSTREPCDDDCGSIIYLDDTLKSFATEWNMTCGSSTTTVQNTQSLLMAGVMTGSFFMGGLGDKFGRFPVLLTAQILCSTFGFLSSFASSWTIYAVLRFFTGFFLSGILIVGFVLTSELVGPSKRNIIGTVPAGAFAVGIAILSYTAWYTQNWRVMSAILGGLGFVVVPVMYRWCEESPRWHLNRGNMKECQAILRKIAKINGHELGEINLKVSKAADGASGETPMFKLFTNPILRKITLVQLFTWFSISSVYYGLTLAAGEIGGNRYMSVVASAIVEIPSNFLVLYVMNIPGFGRVRSCVISLIVSSVFSASIWTASEGNGTTVILACAGKFFIVCSFAIIYVQAAELYPTPVRNVGIGLLSVFARIGGIVSPQIVSLNNSYPRSHFLVFGILGCVSGFICLMLPETLGRPLPESPDDIYGRVKKLNKQVISVKTGDKQLLIDAADDNKHEMEL